jgi:hypothetical protein
MEDLTHQVFDALAMRDCRESYEVHTFQARYKPPQGSPQTLELRVLDRGGRVRQQSRRFIAELKTEDGRVLVSKPAPAAAGAINGLPWKSLAN